MIALTRDGVQKALSGDEKALRSLVDALAPIIQRRVALALLRARRSAKSRDIRQEVEDCTQTVFVALFERDGHALRGWDPERSPIQSFVGLIAEREVISMLRVRRQNPWTEDATDAETLDLHAGDAMGPELDASSRELLVVLLRALEARLSDLGLQLFHLLYLEERSVDEVCAIAQMTPDAVYAWRSRLGRTVRALAHELMSEKTGDLRKGS